MLLPGGEPRIHPGFFDIAGYARSRGLRLTLSTNGTLIDQTKAARLKALEFADVGISLDGIGETHDKFRGRTGAFEKTVAAFRHLRDAGQKSGLRLTLTRHTVSDIDRILDFIEEEDIQRVCFYHLVYSGRGAQLSLLEPHETRAALDRIMQRVEQWHRAGHVREVLTVDQAGAFACVHGSATAIRGPKIPAVLSAKRRFRPRRSPVENPRRPPPMNSVIQFKRLDICRLLAAGREPFPVIRRSLSALKDREGLEIVEPFIPSPLIEMLGSEGFTHSLDHESDGTWVTRFWRE